MKCHWSHDDEGNKFWFPQCMGGAVYGPHGCTCRRREPDPENEKHKERARIIKDQWSEIANLNRIIEKLKKSYRSS